MKKINCDDELIALFIHGNSKAWEEFYLAYLKKANRLANIGKNMFPYSEISFMEFKLIAMECISKALDKYEPGSMSFYSYWKTSVLLEFKHFIENKNIRHQDISFSKNIGNEEELTLSDIYGEIDDNIERIILEKELENYVISKIAELTEDEKKAYIWIMMDETPRSIMARLNWSKRTYYRARKKIQKLLNIEIFKNYFK